MPTAMDVAKYFLATLGCDPESDLTNLKMQKLCAYAQGVSLGLYNRPIFEDQLEAWTHGPVVPAVYHTFKGNGGSPIPSDEDISEKYAREVFNDEEKFVLEAVKVWYGSLSAWTLRDRSHVDFPGEFGSKQEISQEDIRGRFKEMPRLRNLRDYKPPQVVSSDIISEEEFLNAISA